MTKPTENHICLGALSGSFGVQGEVRVKSFCADPTAIATYGALIDDEGRSYTLTLIRPVKGGYAGRLSGVGTKEQADALKGQKLWADRSVLPDLPDDEFYHSDLIGLAVYDTGGAHLGKVSAMHDHGAGDLLELRPLVGNAVLIPFTKAAVPTVDLSLGRVVVDPPLGLLKDEKQSDINDTPAAPQTLEWD